MLLLGYNSARNVLGRLEAVRLIERGDREIYDLGAFRVGELHLVNDVCLVRVLLVSKQF